MLLRRATGQFAGVGDCRKARLLLVLRRQCVALRNTFTYYSLFSKEFEEQLEVEASLGIMGLNH